MKDVKQQLDNGYKMIDICNKKADELEQRYKNLENRRTELEAELRKIEYEKLSLRKEEVNNVCEYIRHHARAKIISDTEIDCYLCHCQNVLNGNIDGTFLTFTKK